MPRMPNKRFDRGLKEANDKQGKRLAVELMYDCAHATLECENDKEDSGDFSDGFWDQKYKLPNSSIIRVEPEMKNAKWWGMFWSCQRPFKFTEMDIPYRKAKNISHLHIVFSKDERYAFVVSRKAMDEQLAATGGEPKFKRTIYEPEGAWYFSTPVSKGKFFERGPDGHWDRWRPTTTEG